MHKRGAGYARLLLKGTQGQLAGAQVTGCKDPPSPVVMTGARQSTRAGEEAHRVLKAPAPNVNGRQHELDRESEPKTLSLIPLSPPPHHCHSNSWIHHFPITSPKAHALAAVTNK